MVRHKLALSHTRSHFFLMPFQLSHCSFFPFNATRSREDGQKYKPYIFGSRVASNQFKTG